MHQFCILVSAAWWPKCTVSWLEQRLFLSFKWILKKDFLSLFCQKCLFLSIFFIQLRRHSSAIKNFQTQLIMFTEYGRKYVNWKCDRSSFYLWLWIYICYFHAYLPQYFSRYIRCIAKFLNLTFKYISRRFATLHTLTCQVLCIVSESLDI